MGDPTRDRAILAVNLSDAQRVELKCKKGEKIIGRSSLCDLILPDLSVSRTHARIVGTDFGFFIEDMSKNGTFIKGRKIDKEPLPENAEISIGPYLLKFRISQEQGEDHDEVPTSLLNDPPQGHIKKTSAKKKALSSLEPADVGIIGKSREVTKMFHLMQKVAPTDFPVLILGETGSGKELVARGVHGMSKRNSHPFVAINCSAISSGLVESELFGHEKGAFTGAVSERKGAFEIAQGGTLFLDEIGEMSGDIQPKLLRALEGSEIQRIGSSESRRVNVRIIAATNREIQEEMEKSNFRKDLFYRLSTFPITIPPLRDRTRDIEALSAHFLEQFVGSYGEEKRICGKGMEMLLRYPWPGNVRELRNVIYRSALISQGKMIEAPVLRDLLSEGYPLDTGSNNARSGKGSMRKIDLAERNAILAELGRTKWNKTRAAKNLGISKSTLFEKLRRYDIKSPFGE